MRRVSTLLLVVLIGASAAWIPSVLADALDVRATSSVGASIDFHPSIHVEGDADFGAPSSGVRSGSGIPHDPYVIRGWAILGPFSPAILLKGTRAHVVIEDVLVDDRGATAGALARCAQGELCVDIGIHLLDAQNVTIRRVQVVNGFWGVLATHARSVLIADSAFGSESALPPEAAAAATPLSLWTGIGLTDSAGITVRNVTTTRTQSPMLVTRGSDIVVEDSRFPASEIALTANGPLTGLTLRRNSFTGVAVELALGTITGLRVEDNRFDGGPWALSAFEVEVVEASICGNEVRGMTEPLGAIYLGRVDGLRLEDNRFEDNRYAFEVLDGVDVTVHRNLVANSTSPAFGAGVGVAGARVHGNSFTGNVGGIALVENMDATGNWWNAADGPSGLPGGSGDRLKTFGADVLVAPWLAEPPALPLHCGSSAGAPAEDQPLPHVSIAASIELEAEADVAKGPARVRAYRHADLRLTTGPVPLFA